MKNLNLYLTIGFAIVGVGCLAVLVVLANSMMVNGVTTQKIGAVVGVAIGFLACSVGAGIYSTKIKAQSATKKLDNSENK